MAVRYAVALGTDRELMSRFSNKIALVGRAGSDETRGNAWRDRCGGLLSAIG